MPPPTPNIIKGNPPTSLTRPHRYNTDEKVNGVGRAFPSPYNPVGPCITGIIDNREGHANPLDGYVIEEGTIPAALAPFMRLLDILPGSASYDESYASQAKASLARWGSRILGPYYPNGAIERTQVYLIMSHDSKCLPGSKRERE